MIHKETKQKVTIPDSTKQVDYRQRLLHQLLAKFLGDRPIRIIDGAVHFKGTIKERVMIQSLLDTCTEELDSIIDNAVYAFCRKYNMLSPKEYELNLVA